VVKVKVLEADEKGRVRLSMKAVQEPQPRRNAEGDTLTAGGCLKAAGSM